MKTPESVSRMRLMKRPSTVVIMPFMRVHATPNRGRIPRPRESAKFIESKLPPVIFRVRLQFVCFAPEFVAGAADEDVFKRGLADGKRLDFSGKSLDDFSDEAVRAFALDANLIFEYRRFYMKAGADALGQGGGIAGRIQQNNIAADFALQLCGRAQGDQIALVHDGEAVTALGFLHEVRGNEH